MKRIIEVDYLKQLLLLLILIVVNSNFAQAQTQMTQEYKNVDHKFIIVFPGQWELIERQIKPDYLALSARSPNQYPVITFMSAPHKEVDKSNNRVEKAQNSNTSKSVIEDQGEIMISGTKAKWILSSHMVLPIRTYSLICYIPTDHHDYLVSMQGVYEDYETDRKTIDEVISNFKILK